MQASKIRFSAAHLFYALSLSAAATSVFGALGLPVAAFVCVIWWQVLSGARRESEISCVHELVPAPRQAPHVVLSSRQGASRIELVAALMTILLIVGLVLPARDDSDPMRQAESSMRMVAKAVRSYEAKHGVALPCMLADDNGEPMHSWRALILAELGEDKLAAAYRFDEPWDGPNNSRLLAYRPWHYRSYYPNCEIESSHTTLHAVAVADELLIVEHEARPVEWLKPDAFSASMWQRMNGLPKAGDGFWNLGFFASRYRGRLAVTDDRVFELQPGSTLSAQQLANSKSTTTERTVTGRSHVELHLATAFRLVFFLLVALYPISWLNRIRGGG